MSSSETNKHEPGSLPAGRLLIVDGHAYAHRAFHAIASLRSPDGAPTNAIFGFIKMMERMIEMLKPTHVAVIWDGGLAKERMALLPEYKAHRPPMPDELRAQFDPIQTWLGASGHTSLSQEGVEADDWIAVLARHAVAQRLSVVIASSDKDFMQLVGPGIGLLNPGDKTQTVSGADRVLEKTGVEPEQVVDWLSLVGDAVDNIPGVPGIGEKTAASLLRQFGSIDVLYQRLDDVKSARLRESLRQAESAVRRNQKMVRLYEQLPLETPLEGLRMKSPNTQILRGLYAQWGFKSMLAQTLDQSATQGVLL